MTEYHVTVVFDLDYTTWQFYSDYERGPYRVVDRETVRNGGGGALRLFPGVEAMLQRLRAGDGLAGACPVRLTLCTLSRTTNPRDAAHLLDLYRLRGYYDRCDFDTGCKAPHLARYYREQQRRCSTVPGAVAAGVVLFDDEYGNISDIEDRVAHTGEPLRGVYVRRGVTYDIVRKAVEELVARASKQQQRRGTPPPPSAADS